MALATSSKEYQLIRDHYRGSNATRSGVPLINHINEGLVILDRIGAKLSAQTAFCLHPLLQGDAELCKHYQDVACNPDVSKVSVLLAMEYRRAANAYLCTPDTDGLGYLQLRHRIGLLLPEVRDMLIADKVQNYKDFIICHQGTHSRSVQLTEYFENWLALLNVKSWDTLCAGMMVNSHAN